MPGTNLVGASMHAYEMPVARIWTPNQRQYCHTYVRIGTLKILAKRAKSVRMWKATLTQHMLIDQFSFDNLLFVLVLPSNSTEIVAYTREYEVENVTSTSFVSTTPFVNSFEKVREGIHHNARQNPAGSLTTISKYFTVSNEQTDVQKGTVPIDLQNSTFSRSADVKLNIHLLLVCMANIAMQY